MAIVLEQQLEMVAVNRLRPHPRNPRQGDINAIAESIHTNGFYGALVAQRSTGYILAGNHRYKAALSEELAAVPVMWADVDDEAALRILLADNRLSDLAGYDDTALAELLQEVANGDLGLRGTGYDADALAELLESLAADIVPDFVPASEDEQSRLDEKAPIICPACGHRFVPASTRSPSGLVQS